MKLNLTKAELGNLTHNPELTLVIGHRDYMKEALADCIALQSELSTLKQSVKDAVEEIGFLVTMTGACNSSAILDRVDDILRSHGLLKEEK